MSSMDTGMTSYSTASTGGQGAGEPSVSLPGMHSTDVAGTVYGQAANTVSGTENLPGTLLGKPPTGEVQAKEGTGEYSIPPSPEGYTLVFGEEVQVDADALESFKALAHAQGLSQGQAGKIAELYASMVAQQEERTLQSIKETEQRWLGELKQSGQFSQTIAHARTAMERFGSQDLFAVLDNSRLGSHPAVVRFVARVGKALAEPSSIRSGASPTRGGLNFYDTMR